MATIKNPFLKQFEERKVAHIELALSTKNQAIGFSGLDQISLIHEALPDLNFNDININSKILGHSLKTPFYIASMTAGHEKSNHLNTLLALAAEMRGWAMGVGSQRRELLEPQNQTIWQDIRKIAPNAILFGNIGLAQAILSKPSDIERLSDNLQAQGMIIHLNALQECLQPEGTPQFKGGYAALERLSKSLSVPIIIKETGCGMSEATLQRLKNLGIQAVDISGLVGTHWGRIEGERSGLGHPLATAAETFRNWGISTLTSLTAAVTLKPNYEIWASGGVRSGLDAAKLLALGANAVGFAKPILQSALKGFDKLLTQMETYEYELKIALFCTNSANIKQLQENHICHIIN